MTNLATVFGLGNLASKVPSIQFEMINEVLTKLVIEGREIVRTKFVDSAFLIVYENDEFFECGTFVERNGFVKTVAP